MISLMTIYYLIWGSIYFIYLLAMVIDLDMLGTYANSIIWYTLCVLFTGLMLIGILTLFYLQGYSFEQFGSRGLIWAGIAVIILIVGLLLYQAWNTRQNYTNVRDKARRRIYRPIDYEYGRDSQDLERRFQIARSTVLNRVAPQSLQELWEQLMVDTPEKVPRLLTEILGDYPRDTPDVQYNLLWYLCISNQPLQNNLSRAEIRYVLGLDHPTLQRLVQDGIRPTLRVTPTYEGMTDRASLIFTLLSGSFVPPPENFTRYDQIKQYSPHIVYNLAFHQYQIINHTDGVYQIYPPHIYVASQPESAVEKVISQITPENCDQLMDAYQLAVTDKSIPFDQKVQRIQADLSSYHHVFNRPEDMLLPPSLQQMTEADIYTILAYYTNLELVEHYEPRSQWKNRNHLLRIIHDDIRGIPKWSILSTNYCTNDATMNIMTGESHGDVDKQDPEDPTLSYGLQKDYRCYQVSELEGSFREYEGMFQFRVPDYLPGDAGSAQFPIESIKQLREMLEIDGRIATKRLLTQITEGIAAMKSAKVQTHIFRQEYLRFSSHQQGIAQKYLAWMFVYSMWMRFWKGPGYPWPMKKVMVEFALTRSLGKRASPEERDEHVFIQEAVRSRIIELGESDPALNQWMTSLVAVHYEFKTKESHSASYTIKEKMDHLALGQECMGFGADTVLKTAYYYILHVLGIEEGAPFDRFIYDQLPGLLELEREIITNQLTTMIGRDNPGRVRVLNHRLDAIARPLPTQPPFQPTTYETNVHVTDH